MESSDWTFEKLGQAIGDVLTLSNMHLFLLIGTGLVAIALVVLAMTRWGQARPVWKCVVLSVAAHVLLVVYAYGTHLIFRAPPAPVADVGVSVNWSNDDDGFGETEDAADAEEADAWDQLASAPTMTAPAEAPAPVRSEEPFQLTRQLSTPAAVEPELNRTPQVPERLAALPPSQTEPALTPAPAPPLDPLEPLGLQGVVETQEAAPLPTPPVEPAPAESAPVPPETEAESERGAAELEAETPQEEQAGEGQAARETAETAETPSAEAADKTPVEIAAPSSDATPKPSVPDVVKTKPEPGQLPAAATSSVPSSPASTTKPVEPVATKRIADGQPLPLLYEARSAPNRLNTAIERGGSEKTEAAVELALRWLASQQEADGRWNPRATGGGQERLVLGENRHGAGIQADSAVTALAVLAFMAHGHTHLKGAYRETVQHGLEYLVRSQASNGDLAGAASFFARTYCHSMALLAVSEALALTGDQRLRPAVQAGVHFTCQAQNRQDGGWRYQPGDGGDMSQFGWVVLALHSAELGGVPIPANTRQSMKRFLNSCAKGTHKGLASYRPGEGPSTTMTAEALVCRNFLEGSVGRRAQEEASRQILRETPQRERPNLYYWYYGTLAMYNAGGEGWDRWNEDLKQALVTTQVAAGPQQGSWEPNGLWAGYGGRVYSTAMAALCLEVYYRYLPMHEVAERGRARRR